MIAGCETMVRRRDTSGLWAWGCLTCQSLKGRWSDWRGDFVLKSDAEYAAKSHRRMRRRHLATREAYRVWHAAILATDNPDEYVALVRQRFPRLQLRTDVSVREIMDAYQGEYARFREGAK